MSTLSRREFLRWAERALGAVGLATVATPVVAFFYPSDLSETPGQPVSAGPASALTVGQSKTVGYGRYPAIVINTASGLRAYSAVCTHFACIVNWDAERGEIVCPCHAATFDPSDGHVTGGPPPRGLDAIDVAVVGGEIMVGSAT
jgi:cytochrome b6-f complex iron-sulfur subunit